MKEAGIFQKKPLRVTAIRIVQANLSSLLTIASRYQNKTPMRVVTEVEHEGDGQQFISYVKIRTLEGEMLGDLGDWLIIGINGELYPCKHDIFINSYEPVDA